MALLTIATSMAIAMAQPADAALKLSTNGMGDAVYVPYYTIQNGQTTLLTVTNHSDTPTAARVHFSEALNGQAVLYFHVYLPPQARWVGAVTEGPNGGARLHAATDTCSVPSWLINTELGADFAHWDYSEYFPDGAATDLSRTRSGQIEILEFAPVGGDMAREVYAKDCAALDKRYLGTDRTPFPVQSDRQDFGQCRDRQRRRRHGVLGRRHRDLGLLRRSVQRRDGSGAAHHLADAGAG